MARKSFNEDLEISNLELDEDETYVSETSGYIDEEDDEQAIWDGDEFIGEEDAEEFSIEDDEY